MKGGTVMIVIWGSLFMLIVILFIRLIIRERQKKKNSDDPDQLRYSNQVVVDPDPTFN